MWLDFMDIQPAGRRHEKGGKYELSIKSERRCDSHYGLFSFDNTEFVSTQTGPLDVSG